MSAPIVIFGLGDSGRIARLYFEEDGTRQVVAFSADDERCDVDSFEDLPVVPASQLTKKYPPATTELYISVGYSKVNKVRAHLFQRFRDEGYHFASYVHPSVKIWPGTEIGENVFIYENNTLQPGVKLGENVIIWSNNHIGHDSTVGDHVFMASEACIAGNVTIEERCFIGISAAVRDGITIGAGCVVGAGALMLADAEENGVYTGQGTERHRIPASRLRGL